MRQKYIIKTNKENNEIVIEELSRIGKGVYELLYIAKYRYDILKEAMEHGAANLIYNLRTEVFFPTDECAKMLAEAIMGMGESDEISVLFNDINMIENEDILDEVLDDDEIDEDAIDDDSEIINDLFKDDEDISTPSKIKVAEYDIIDTSGEPVSD